MNSVTRLPAKALACLPLPQSFLLHRHSLRSPTPLPPLHPLMSEAAQDRHHPSVTPGQACPGLPFPLLRPVSVVWCFPMATCSQPTSEALPCQVSNPWDHCAAVEFWNFCFYFGSQANNKFASASDLASEQTSTSTLPRDVSWHLSQALQKLTVMSALKNVLATKRQNQYCKGGHVPSNASSNRSGAESKQGDPQKHSLLGRSASIKEPSQGKLNQAGLVKPCEPGNSAASQAASIAQQYACTAGTVQPRACMQSPA